MENNKTVSVNIDNKTSSVDTTIQSGKTLKPLPSYSVFEDKLNVYTHFFGAIFGACSFIVLLTMSLINGAFLAVMGSFIFGASLVYLYTNSTIYHNTTNEQLRRKRQKLDHSGINVLICGSNTFFMLAGVNQTLGYILFAVNLILSIISMVLNVINVKKFRVITMMIYIITGWMCIFIAPIIVKTVGWLAFGFLLGGGLSYTFGLSFYSIKRPYMHTVWHFFVLGGSIAHVISAIIILL